jgi:hypothetical protein
MLSSKVSHIVEGFHKERKRAVPPKASAMAYACTITRPEFSSLEKVRSWHIPGAANVYRLIDEAWLESKKRAQKPTPDVG